ncbi:uncharacterized protein LOC114525405 [Dendronephthya gigantea]|uniref:uncharacterized protein LOC114525405 n=1 Tax=Dendronephthya gigantea TaxID=151771 RepID=UPI00106D14BA|nr:uncharacterized protein LOC114525405 [Dendronephthya gigantea]
MIANKVYLAFVVFGIHYFIVQAVPKGRHGLLHKKTQVLGGKATKRFNNFHATQNIDDLVRNPSALNRDELNEINKLDNMNDMFMNPEVSSETQDLARQGLDPSVAMQISKIDHNLGDILGPKRANQAAANIPGKQKGEILAGYGEQYNLDGSVSMTNNEWPEYQLKDSPPVINTPREGLNSMLPGNGNVNGLQPMGGGDSPQVSPQAALNPNLLPGQKSDLGMGMGVGMDKQPLAPMMQKFVSDVANGKSLNKHLLNAPFEKPGIRNAGFRIPGEFSFKGERKSDQGSQEEENQFVKNFMSSKKSHTARRKTAKKTRQ